MLRKALKETACAGSPAAHDCLSARIIEAVGFKAVLLASSMTGDAQFGLPSIGLTTATELLTWPGTSPIL